MCATRTSQDEKPHATLLPLRAYWGAWVAILSRQGAKVNSSRPLRYVDGFAGPGVYDKGEPGSPILALKVALSHEAILSDFVRIREESRTNTAVLDPTTGLHTEINERGPAVSAMELELFRDHAHAWLADWTCWVQRQSAAPDEASGSLTLTL